MTIELPDSDFATVVTVSARTSGGLEPLVVEPRGWIRQLFVASSEAEQSVFERRFVVRTAGTSKILPLLTEALCRFPVAPVLEVDASSVTCRVDCANADLAGVDLALPLVVQIAKPKTTPYRTATNALD